MERAAIQIVDPITVASTSATIPLEVASQLQKMRILLAEDKSDYPHALQALWKALIGWRI
jgi:hypothetical protein